MSAIQAAMDELMAEIQARQDAVTALSKLCPLELRAGNGSKIQDGAVTIARLAAPPARKCQGKKKTKGTQSKAGEGPTLLMGMAAKLTKLNEPFGTKEIAAAAKLEWKAASNFITRASAMGWLKRTGVGEYARTAKFPNSGGESEVSASKAHTVLPGPGHKNPGRTKAQMENELAAALKERDQHRADGRVTMEGIAQKKVDRLEEELEKFQ